VAKSLRGFILAKLRFACIGFADGFDFGKGIERDENSLSHTLRRILWRDEGIYGVWQRRNVRLEPRKGFAQV
jgi:hypothetical protein